MYVSPCGGEDWASARAIAIRAGTERTQSAAGWTYAASLSRWGDTSTDGPKLGAGFVCVCVWGRRVSGECKYPGGDVRAKSDQANRAKLIPMGNPFIPHAAE